MGEFAYERLTDRRVIYYCQKLAKPWRDSPTSTLAAQIAKHQNTESKRTKFTYLCARILLLSRKSEDKPVIDIKYNSGMGQGFYTQCMEGTLNVG